MSSLPSARWLALPLLLAAGLHAAQRLRQVAEPPTAAIARAVKQLGDDDFNVREKASRILWQAGQAAEPALQAAAASGDAEVARRAEEILDKFRWGVFPNTPAAVVGLIDAYRVGDQKGKEAAVLRLLDKGGPGCAAVRRILTAEPSSEARTALVQLLGQQAERAMPSLLAEERFDTVEGLLECAAASRDAKAIRNYVACLLLRGRIDAGIAAYQKRERSEDPALAAEILAYLYRAKGDLTAARRWAEKARKGDLLDTILYLQRDWPALLDRHKDRAAGEEGLGLLLCYQRLSGQTRDVPKTVAGLRKTAEEKKVGDGSIWWSAKPLFLNDMVDEGLAILPRGHHYAMILDILGAQLRFREAFALADKVKEAEERLTFSTEVQRALLLHDLGERDRAAKILTELAKDPERPGENWEWRGLVEALVKTGRKEAALELLVRLFEKDPKRAEDSWWFSPVFPERGEQAKLWWRFLRYKTPALTPAATARRVRDLVSGGVGREEFTALVREMLRVEVLTDASVDSRPPRWDGSAFCFPRMAAAAQAAGHVDLARECLEEAAKRFDTAADWQRLADHEVMRKDWGAAAGHYGKAWQKDPAQPEPLALRGWVLLQAGRAREGERLLERARWLALGDEKKCRDLAELLVKFGRPAEARRQREINLHLSLLGSWYLGNALDKGAGDVERRKDYAAAADLEELALLMVIHRGFFFADDRSFVRAPHRVHFLRARGLWDAGKVEPALAELRVCQRLLPGNLSMPLFFVPALEKAGRQKEADEIFGRAFAAYDGPCRDHPRWAKGHNDLAWLSARCRRRLDEALTHAEKAVALEPERVGYLDTLAEVWFQRGDKERAIGLMKKCREKEPKNDFYARQLRRYEAGDPKTDVPEQ